MRMNKEVMMTVTAVVVVEVMRAQASCSRCWSLSLELVDTDGLAAP